VKVRVGFGLGASGSVDDPERFGQLLDALERHRFDSLGFSERLTGPSLDPVVAMAFAVARTERLKIGTSVMVLPGRNPVVLAKAIAGLDRLSGGRVLPAFGLGAPDSAEHGAFGVERSQRGAWFNEALPLMRRLWAEDAVSHRGERFHLDEVTIGPKPVQQPLEVWGAGNAPLELVRVGRFCDGWLPSFSTPREVAAGRVTIEEVASEHGRSIDPEHYGALIAYRPDGTDVPDRLAAVVRSRKPDAEPSEMVPTRSGLVDAIGRFVDVGFSKFVLVPLVDPPGWEAEVSDLSELVSPLQT
jgi:probable F420-dependent oxidoreductase